MSAIWGTISFQNTIPGNADFIMRPYYENNCKIDRSSMIQDHNYYFGCGLQYITPEARNETLPFFDASQRLCFTADCLLDNRGELLHLLEEKDTALPDGSLMLAAYRRWGISCVSRFRGLFSFAVYDIKKNTVYLATDQVSGRCLYYYRDKDRLTFSTLLKPLLSLHNDLTFNQQYLKDFLTAPGLMPSVVSDETPFQGVYKLNPGTYMEFSPADTHELSYWTPGMSTADTNCRSPEEFGSYFRGLYEDCIHDALRTDGNIGIALSSGLDSASVGAIAADFLKKDGKNLYAYTYVPYEPVRQDKNTDHIHNEENDVKKIAGMHPNMLPHFLCNNGKNCFDEIGHDIKIMEIPYKAYGNLPSLFEIYGKASEASCKIVLSGQMGNSTVSYSNIDNILYDLYLNGKYLSFLDYLNHYGKTVKESRKQALKGCMVYFRHAKKEYSDSRFRYTPDNPFLNKSIGKDYPMAERYTRAGLVLSDGKLPIPGHMYQKYLYMKSAYTYMGELETKAGLAYGLLLRDPTKDMRLLGFCYHLPYHLFAYRGVPRWLIRSQAKDILPACLLDHWGRYGVQNSDCHTRLIRDWEQLYPVMKEQSASVKIAPFINAKAVSDFFAGTKASLSDKDEMETQYLIILNVLYSFLNYYMET